jgi:hypothetical protein
MSYKIAVECILDTLNLRGLDAEQGYTARVLVEQTLAQIFRHQSAAAKFATDRRLISIDTSLHPGTEEWGYNELMGAGQATEIAPDADDVPTVDVASGRRSFGVVSAAIGFRIGRQEVRRAALQGTYDLAIEKGVAAREAIDKYLDNRILFGVPAAGIQGLLNVKGNIEVGAANGDWTNVATDGDDIVDDVAGAIEAMITNSDGVEMPDTVVLPIAQYQAAARKRITENNPVTALAFLQGLFPFVTRWEWHVPMATAYQSAPAVLIYNSNPSRVRAVMPLPPTPIPRQEEGLVTKVGFEWRFAGVMSPRPKSITVLYGV